jgi:hypothetical protein
LLIAAWPANVRMLIDARASQEPRWWLALQVVLIAWVWRTSQPRRAA